MIGVVGGPAVFIREIAVVKNKIKRYTNTTWGESNNSGVVVVPALLTITISGRRWLKWEAFFLVRCVFFIFCGLCLGSILFHFSWIAVLIYGLRRINEHEGDDDILQQGCIYIFEGMSNPRTGNQCKTN